ncbi:MAG: YfhO family protein [Bacteroidales bacterium]|nr:YfhO family protein [Bacteroidales bacterium]
MDRFILGSHAMIKTHDQFDSYWPFQKALAERIVHFQMPGWLPDFAGGIPFFIWDVNWLFFPVIIHGLFPEPWSVTAITIIQFFLAGFGMHLFLRHFFNMDEYICFFGGLLWALSTFSLTYWRIFDLAALPLLFYCTDRIAFVDDRKLRLLLIGGLLLCTMNLWLIKGALFLAPFHFFFILFVHKSWQERKRAFVVFVLVWGFVALLNLPMIMSLLANASHSSRKLIEWVPQDTSWQVIRDSIIWFFFNPIHQSVIALGFVASLIVFFGFYHFKRWDRLTKKIVFYYIIVLFFAQFIIYSSWFIAFWQSLPVSGFRLYRLIMVAPFVMFMVAMINIDKFLDFLRGSPMKVFLLVVITASIPIATQLTRNAFPSNYLESFVIFSMAAATLAGIFILRKKGAGKKAYIILFIILIFSERLIQINLSRPADVHPPSFTHFYKSELFDRFRPPQKYDYRIAFINQHPVVGLYNDYQVAGGIGQY